MAKALTLPQLKRQLKEMTHQELIDLISTLYKENKSTKDLINLKFQGDSFEEKVFEEYKEKAEKIIHPKRSRLGIGFDIKSLKALFKDYQKLNPKSVYLLELQAFYLEGGLEFTNTFGDIDMTFYNYLCTLYSNIVDTIFDEDEDEGEQLFQRFKERLASYIEQADFGWGVQEYFLDAYMELISYFGE
ncbi:MAG: hypothetical protein LBS41_03485 [Streptococcaceae bacterium]|jgi:hypothetical protein|nr:hypothetical protein [Streptococcaceae bacterium]